MSGWFSVPEWDGPAGAGKAAADSSVKSQSGKKTRVNPKKPAQNAAQPSAVGQFVRPPKSQPTPAAAPKRKLEKPAKKSGANPEKSSKVSPAKKRKLDDKKPAAPASAKNEQKNSVKAPAKNATPVQQKKTSLPPTKSNETVTKKPATNKPFSMKNVVTKEPKKKPAKPAKKLALADEESDTELAAEVNIFRKKLLEGFSGAREVGGKPDPNAKFSDDDEDDFGLSESEDEAPRKKNAKQTKKKAVGEADAVEVVKVAAAKKPGKSVAELDADDDEDDDEEAPTLVPATDGGNNSFRDKLIGNLKGSRFRYLNEQLYCSEGSSAVKLFKEDRAAFTAYHEGYRQQVQQWPLNPLDRIIKSIKKLPKTMVIADFGCGEGRLAKAVPNKTYSLDLVAQRHEIIACDMAKTPLETASIDVAVYCLSLMGTNLRDFVLEANRVLKMGGQLKIAEVESRFDDVRTFVEHIKSCGFQHINTDKSSKFFVFLNFKKVRGVDKSNKQVPAFSLKPCLYKKR